jgi:hypothetical protein
MLRECAGLTAAGVGLVCLAAVASLASFASIAEAQVPEKMDYQVMLTDDSDQPLADATVSMAFRLYDAESGGTLKWSENQDVTTNSIGVASVVLGSVGTIYSPDFVDPLWLEVEVDGQILSPRRELVSAPYAFYAADSDALGGLEADDYVTDLTLSMPGAINDVANPVDWTRLKSVPTGFADGTDDVGGTGDGYSLDADDGDPADALYVASDGSVGIGTTSPIENLHIHDSTGPSYVRYTNATTGSTSGDGLTVGIDDAGEAYVNQSEAAGINFMTDGAYRGRFDSDGTFELGSDTATGAFELYQNGGVDPIVEMGGYFSGGGLALSNTSGQLIGSFGPSLSGNGYLEIPGPTGSIVAEGQDMFTYDTSLSITGGASAMGFYAGLSGDSSVDLPNNAIAANEIADEPGITSTFAYDQVSLDDGYNTLLSSTITAPGPGYILAIATAWIECAGDSPADGTYFGLSEDDHSLTFGTRVYAHTPSGAGTGTWQETVTAHGVYEADYFGTNTIYFLGNELNGDHIVHDRKLTLIYIPTSYGTVERSETGAREQGGRPIPGTPLTDSDVRSASARSIADNQARVDAELAEMREEMLTLKARLEEMRPRETSPH